MATVQGKHRRELTRDIPLPTTHDGILGQSGPWMPEIKTKRTPRRFSSADATRLTQFDYDGKGGE